MSEWISIKDRTPEDGTRDEFLICDEYGRVRMSDWCYDDQIGWCFWYDHEATHWMPLPEPPPKP